MAQSLYNDIRLVVALDRIDDNPYQTRTVYDPAALEALADDIARNGLQQVPAGRITGADGQAADLTPFDRKGGPAVALSELPTLRVQIAFGHRRLRALRILAARDPERWSSRVAIIYRPLNDEQMAMIAWSENEQRSDLTALEKAHAIRTMMDAFAWTQTQVADKLGLARPTVSNKLRLLDLPPDMQANVAGGTLSERQALAVTPVLALPQETQEAVHDLWEWRQLNQAVESGKASSDDMRRLAETIVDRVTCDLSKAGFPLQETITGDGVRTPACTDCPLKLSGDRCGDRQCYERKGVIWEETAIIAAAAAVGLPYATLKDQQAEKYQTSKWKLFGPSYPADISTQPEQVLQIALDKHCPNLYVARRTDKNILGPADQPGVTYVCRRHGKCQCAAAFTEAAAKDSQAAEAERARRVADLKRLAIEDIATALAVGDPAAWRAVYTELVLYGQDREKARAITDHQAILRKVAAAVLEKELYISGSPAPDVVEKKIQGRLAALGIVSSEAAGDDPLADLRRRWARLSAWCNKLSVQRPTIEAVRGNIENIMRMINDLMSHLDDTKEVAEQEGPAADMLREALGWLDALQALAPVVAAWDGEGFDVISWLVGVPTGDGNFKGAIERAPLAAIRYARALAMPSQQVRRDVFDREISKRERGAAQAALAPLREEALRQAVSSIGHYLWPLLAEHRNDPKAALANVGAYSQSMGNWSVSGPRLIAVEAAGAVKSGKIKVWPADSDHFFRGEPDLVLTWREVFEYAAAHPELRPAPKTLAEVFGQEPDQP
jgi:ParB/RepB/Spo0J family partition protein